MAEQYLSVFVIDPVALPDGPAGRDGPGAPAGEAVLPGRHWEELTAALRVWA
ncbi:hypothetical protein [Catenuloplanes indicus]|uniref:Uncharacterized protein n=1 Tax=Catenuloplanes indicus TaxID=137267 RepID=A0AAE4AVA5_9ACTN|nr:hypothetical protein [Catenuloplanes indicus]MDQ0363739.1 hypothetical protein [Catenuloplanes indicus]